MQTAVLCLLYFSLFGCRNGHLCDVADMSKAHSADLLRPSSSDPDFSALNCNDDIPFPVKIYQSDESCTSLLISKVSSEPSYFSKY